MHVTPTFVFIRLGIINGWLYGLGQDILLYLINFYNRIRSLTIEAASNGLPTFYVGLFRTMNQASKIERVANAVMVKVSVGVHQSRESLTILMHCRSIHPGVQPCSDT